MAHFIVLLPAATEQGVSAYSCSSRETADHFAKLDGGTVHPVTKREANFVLANGMARPATLRRLGIQTRH